MDLAFETTSDLSFLPHLFDLCLYRGFALWSAARGVVIVATLRALKMHGGVAKTDLSEENVQAVRDGFSNLKRHVDRKSVV